MQRPAHLAVVAAQVPDVLAGVGGVDLDVAAVRRREEVPAVAEPHLLTRLKKRCGESTEGQGSRIGAEALARS